jgi:phage pi2 protein 07
METYGFIITRHVRCEETNKYWNNSIRCLRYLYPHRKIVIIDDNSNPNFLKEENSYENIQVINSEFIGRGELLPYYYYLKYKFFDNAIILHDSIFIHKRINFTNLIKRDIKVLPIWSFFPDKENLENRVRILNSLKNSYNIYSKIKLENIALGMSHDKWLGCFGVQSFINHDFLILLENKYKITNMISHVKCRQDRCSLERIFGCLFCTEYPKLLKIQNNSSLLGNIHKYQKWGYTYSEYEENIKNKKLPKAIVKIWTGR